MTLLQRWHRVRRRERDIKEAINEYNEAVQMMSGAARKLLNVARKTGTETSRLTAAVMQMEKVAECALITEDDLKGGADNGSKKRRRPRDDNSDSGNSCV